MEEKLSVSLTNSGYRRLNSNVNGIYLFYYADENDIRIISMVHMLPGIAISAEQYENIIAKIKSAFADPLKRLHLLNIIISGDPGRAKQLFAASADANHWIIDSAINRLIIYENQADDFYGLKAIIEKLLEEEPIQTHEEAFRKQQYSNGSLWQQSSRQGSMVRTSGGLQLTAVNITLITLNILIFISVRYIPLFEGYAQAISRGALSWYRIINNREYYRIISSMFIHSDISHIFNNMLLLLFVGGILEKLTGRIKYLIIYFGSGIIAGICSMGYNMVREYSLAPYTKTTVSVGASGAIFGVVGAILFIVIINKGRLEQISFRQLMLFIILSLYNGIANAQIDQTAHIGGFIGGLLLAAVLYRRSKTIEDKESF